MEEYGKQVPVKVKVVDTESDPTKAAEVASRLILNDKVDMIYVSSSPITVNPVAGNCERHKTPCIGTMMPVEMFLAGGPYTWSFVASISVMDFTASFVQMWNQVPTNKKIGLLALNDQDGVAWAEGSRNALPAAGYEVIDLGRFPMGTNDYTTFINDWKKNNVEILFGNLAPPDFMAAWRQCLREGFTPKIATIGKALLFVSVLDAIGEIGYGLSTEAVWHPSYPYKSSLAGYSAQDLADAWEKDKKQAMDPASGRVLFRMGNRGRCAETGQEHRQGKNPQGHCRHQHQHHSGAGQVQRQKHLRHAFRRSAVGQRQQMGLRLGGGLQRQLPGSALRRQVPHA